LPCPLFQHHLDIVVTRALANVGLFCKRLGNIVERVASIGLEFHNGENVGIRLVERVHDFVLGDGDIILAFHSSFYFDKA